MVLQPRKGKEPKGRRGVVEILALLEGINEVRSLGIGIILVENDSIIVLRDFNWSEGLIHWIDGFTKLLISSGIWFAISIE